MSRMVPHGTFPTPYGVSVPVYRPDPIDPRDPDAFVFDPDATATCAGIHDPEDRRRFKAATVALRRFPPFEEYGGGKLLHVALPIPRKPAYPRIAENGNTPVEAWTTSVMDRFRWCDRAAFLLDIIGDNMGQVARAPGLGVVDALVQEIYPLGLSLLLTAALEHLHEAEIDCLEAAAIYALTEHEEWRRAGERWLRPVHATWFRDWRRARPVYGRFAHGVAGMLDVPAWVADPEARL